jgi:hypothetical protein
MPDTNCLYTTVQNLTGKAHSFGFLGAHGRRLAANEQYSEYGNLLQKVASRFPWSRRRSEALERALLGSRLAIISTPIGVVKDATTGNSKMLTLTNGTLGVADTCFPAFKGTLTGAFTAIGAQVAAIATATITFTAPVSGFSVADVAMTRGGSPVTLTGVTVSTTDNKVFTINGLTSLTGTNGNYVITVASAGSGIVDIYNNALSANATVSWTKS